MIDAQEKIRAAAVWLADQKEPPQNVIHVMRQRFGITAIQAAIACTEARQSRKGGANA